MSVQLTKQKSAVTGSFCQYRGQRFYKIEQYHQMANFFMSVVSSSDHWLFISSNGGLTMGRQNAQRAFFPYYTEDKLSDMAHCTGPVTFIREGEHIWQPFAAGSLLTKPQRRTLYKSTLGDQLFFSELQNGLCFEYGWSFSDRLGIVRTVSLTNTGAEKRKLSLLDGLQNILPANVTTDLQTNNSVLLDAYKSTDCIDQNIGIYSLSSRITDLAEPAESLTANTVWHCVKGSAFKPTVSIDSQAPQQFVQQENINTESRVRGQRGGYFLQADIELQPGEQIEWYLVCEVTQDSGDVHALKQLAQREQISDLLAQDIETGNQALKRHLAKVDGLQTTDQELTTVHHQANALFNMMRGGFFEDGYAIEKQDLQKFISVRQTGLMTHDWWQSVPQSTCVIELETLLASCDSVSLKRLVREYLPISFSRRHGDPSRPWNQFSINLKDEAGTSIKDYQGNWRDIFQNWEPLAYSYPKFLPAMISAFLNATSADGYNPYRVTRQGIEWEEPEPDNAWANIGYWSDHQIIYLSKLLELQAQIEPDWFANAIKQERFTYANVPYRIKHFAQLAADPYDSIQFDEALNAQIQQRVRQLGTDGKLLLSAENDVIHTNLIEKLLTLWLAKLSNFVPGGGLWMNTQRPEWNDANNALAGWGLSVVTIAYLHRHLRFMQSILEKQSGKIRLNQAVATWFQETKKRYESLENKTESIAVQTVSELIGAADTYREGLYQNGLPDQFEQIPVAQLTEFLTTVIRVLAATLRASKRDDALYHGYNILHLQGDTIQVEHLPVMLEGQVAMLSANLLDAKESVECLQALRQSDLYREDQHTYTLYPNKTLPEFVNRNQVKAQWLDNISQIQSQLFRDRVLTESSDGHLHFDVSLRNAKDLKIKLHSLNYDHANIEKVEAVWEKTFHHKSFTGRSGSFFGYEGLGSTYWHMVSKLLLAAQENFQMAVAANDRQAETLADIYYDIRAGIGFNKTPTQYGAFPTDPYSHTPETGIARQPGMTGQVKEELITRFGELGLSWKNGVLCIDPLLLKSEEFLSDASVFDYLDTNQSWQSLALSAGSLGFTFAQVPFVYRKAAVDHMQIQVTLRSADVVAVTENWLSTDLSLSLMERRGDIVQVEVQLPIDNA